MALKNKKGEDIVRFISDCGIPCEIVSIKRLPQYTFYYFKVKNFAKFTPSNIKLSIFKLSAFEGVQFYQNFNCVNNSNFSVYCSANNRELLLNDIILPMEQANNKLTFTTGIGQDGDAVNLCVYNLTHILISGTTGSGKSVFLSSLIYQLYKFNTFLKFYIIDKKQSLTYFSRCKNCEDIATNDNEAILLLQKIKFEMYSRFEKLKIIGIDNGKGFFPPIIIFIDELSDLMLSEQKDKIKELLVNIAQLGRAACVFLAIATQSPRVSVLDGLLLANIPTKIAFKSVSARESVLILGHKGAENLVGKGDCIVKLPYQVDELHIQAPFICQEEIKKELKELGGEL